MREIKIRCIISNLIYLLEICLTCIIIKLQVLQNLMQKILAKVNFQLILILLIIIKLRKMKLKLILLASKANEIKFLKIKEILIFNSLSLYNLRKRVRIFINMNEI